MEAKMVMFDSNEAATFKTGLEGWVSGDGIYFGKDERTARYSGCTHRICATCANVIDKHRTYCRSCEESRRAEKWAKLPVEKWDGPDPLSLGESGWYHIGLGAALGVHQGALPPSLFWSRSALTDEIATWGQTCTVKSDGGSASGGEIDGKD